MEESTTNSQSTSGSSSNPQAQSKVSNEDRVKQAVNILSETTSQLANAVEWMTTQLNVPGNVFKVRDAIGQTAEITLSIPNGGTGELVVILGNTRKYYAAKAKNPGEDFKRGTKVKIADVAVNTMYVENLET